MYSLVEEERDLSIVIVIFIINVVSDRGCRWADNGPREVTFGRLGMVFEAIAIAWRNTKQVTPTHQKALHRDRVQPSRIVVQFAVGHFQRQVLIAHDGKRLGAGSDTFRIFNAARWQNQIPHDVTGIERVPIRRHIKGLSGQRGNLAFRLGSGLGSW